MTIQRRLSASFLVILLLFTANLAIYFWSSQRRESTVEELRRAISRQILLSSVNQSLNDIQKQVTLLNQVAIETSATGADPAEIAQFNQQVDQIGGRIDDLGGLSEAGARDAFESLAGDYARLRESWRIFYENFGVDQEIAITELVVRAEPLSQEIIQQRMPALQAAETSRVEAASANFYEVAQLTDRTTILIFAISALVAVGVAVLVPAHLNRGLRTLKAGAASIGSGRLDRRITLAGDDELTDLAAAFNEMTAKLAAARGQLTRANEQERKKSEELAGALDQLQRTQDQLVVQQKLASLGSLTAGIAHEIKNPLNFVTNFAEVSAEMLDELRELLSSAPPDDGKAASGVRELLGDLEENLGKIREHGTRADGIVRGMLMHSRGDSGKRELTDLNTLVAEYVKLAYHGMRAQDSSFNVTIEEDYDDSMEPVSVVPHDLSRVFLNIANNACYAAYQKMRESGNGFSPVVSVQTRNRSSTVEIRIRDNGNGIPDEVVKRVFEPFFTTKPTGSGTGLGLSMSYEIVVQQHHGEFRIETEPGAYAEFIVVLPKGVHSEERN